MQEKITKKSIAM